MLIRNNYKATLAASYLGYITQAIMLNFPPLLFIFFQENMGLSLSQVSVLISANFVTELVVDILASKYASKIGYRPLVIVGNSFATVGLICLFLLPMLMESCFVALIISMMLCGAGGGFMEVLISPIVEACPTKNKSGMMSLLHSFYCWGQAGVVLISTIFFQIFSLEYWMYVAVFWTLIPILGLVLFIFAPIYTLEEEGDGTPLSHLVKNKVFWLFVLMMICAGASELAMSQWASAFAEKAIGDPELKWLTDLLGPCLFAVCMGCARVFYAKMSEKINLEKSIFVSSLICVLSYLIAIFAPIPAISLAGCALCGIGVGIMWPGTFSMSSVKIPKGGVMLFGMLALAGDFGCLVGPSMAGYISSMFNKDLRVGFAVSLIFPITLAIICGIMLFKRKKQK